MFKKKRMNEEEVNNTDLKPAKEKKPFYKKTWFLVIAGLIILSQLFGGNNSKEKPETNKTALEESVKKEPVKEEPKEEPKVGDKLIVGDAEIIAKKVFEKTEYKSNNQFIKNVKTKGKFVQVNLEITNKGNESKMFHRSRFKLIDDKNREFDPSDNFELLSIVDSNLFLKDVNPDMSIDGKLVFEVPADVESYSLEYSELFSDGQIKLK